MQRRAFLKTVGAATGGLALGYRPLFADPAAADRQLIPHASGMPRRVLGRTGRQVSIITYPGLALSKIPQPAATTALRAGFDAGINYFDVAPAYGDAEIKMGIALADGKIPRDDIFLACKTKDRTADGARRELERSLTRLKTDRFDLYQMHVMSTKAELEQAFGSGGAMETLLKAREEGKVRWLGFSAHTKEAALEMLRRFKFDTVMYPVNFIEHFTHQFDPEVLTLARQHGAAVVAIKPISAGAWRPGEKKTRNNWWYRVLEEQAEIDQAIRFALSLDPVVTVVPTSFVDLTEKSILAGKSFKPAVDADLAAMRDLAGKYTPLFPRNPSWVLGPGPHTEYYRTAV
ncbi:MAG: aldo/keto reductase [Verrucomicrobia bacterium]|nr:aldo/keto reductase [Verrucomicrobiota bacterium]